MKKSVMAQQRGNWAPKPQSQRPKSQPPIKFEALGQNRQSLYEKLGESSRLAQLGARFDKPRRTLGSLLQDDDGSQEIATLLERQRQQMLINQAELACLSPLSSSNSNSTSSLNSSTLSLTTSSSASTVLAAPSGQHARQQRGSDSSTLPSSNGEEEDEEAAASHSSSSSTSGVSSYGDNPSAAIPMEMRAAECVKITQEVHSIKSMPLQRIEGQQVVLEAARRFIMTALRVASASGRREPTWFVSLEAASGEGGGGANGGRLDLEWFQLQVEGQRKSQLQIERAHSLQIIDCLQEHELLIWLIDRSSKSCPRVESAGQQRRVRRESAAASSPLRSHDDALCSPSFLRTGGNLIGVSEESQSLGNEEPASLEALIWLCASEEDAKELHRFWLACAPSTQQADASDGVRCDDRQCMQTENRNDRSIANGKPIEVASREEARPVLATEDATRKLDDKLEQTRAIFIVGDEAIGAFESSSRSMKVDDVEESVLVSGKQRDHLVSSAAVTMHSDDHRSSASRGARANPRRRTIAPTGSTGTGTGTGTSTTTAAPTATRDRQQVYRNETSEMDDLSSSLPASVAPNEPEKLAAVVAAAPRRPEDSCKSDQMPLTGPPVVKPRTSILKRQQQLEQMQLRQSKEAESEGENEGEDDDDELEKESTRKVSPIRRASVLNRSMKLAPLAQRPKSILKKPSMTTGAERRDSSAGRQQATQVARASKVVEAEESGKPKVAVHQLEAVGGEPLASSARASESEPARVEGGKEEILSSPVLVSDGGQLVLDSSQRVDRAQSLDAATSSSVPIIAANRQQQLQKPIERRKSVHLIAVRASADGGGTDQQASRQRPKSKEGGVELETRAESEKVEFVACEDRERAFERLRSRASCYDITRLMSKNSTLQSQLAKLRAAAEANKAKQQNETTTVKISESYTNKRQQMVSSDAHQSQHAERIAADPMVGGELEHKHRKAKDIERHGELEMSSGRSMVLVSGSDGSARAQVGAEQSVQSKGGEPEEEEESTCAASTSMKEPVEPAKRQKSILKVSKPNIEEVKSSSEHVEMESDAETASDSDTEVEEPSEQKRTDCEQKQPKMSKFSLLRQSFNQKTLSSMLKFSSRASMRIKSTVAPLKPAIDANENDGSEIKQDNEERFDKAKSVLELKTPIMSLQKPRQKQEQQQIVDQATAIMLHNQQQHQLMQRQRQQHQIIYQQRYAAALQQQQVMMQRQHQYAAYAYANQYIATQQALLVPPVVSNGPMVAQAPISMVPLNQHYQHSQQMVHSLIPQLPPITRSNLKRPSKKVSIYPNQQKPGVFPMAVSNHHSSVNIVYASTEPAQAPGHKDAPAPTRSSLGASMRKTVKSILINRSSNVISSEERAKQPAQKQLKSALKSSNSHKLPARCNTGGSALVLNSEGSSDGDHSSSTIEGDPLPMTRQTNSNGSNYTPKSVLKKTRQTDFSSSTSSIGQTPSLSAAPSNLFSSSVGSINHHESANNFKRSVATRCSRRNKSLPCQSDRSSSNESIVDKSRSTMSKKSGEVVNPRKNVTFSTKLTSIK